MSGEIMAAVLWRFALTDAEIEEADEALRGILDSKFPDLIIVRGGAGRIAEPLISEEILVFRPRI